MVDRQPGSAKGHEGNSGEKVLRSLVGDREWFLESTGQTEFVCNVLLLLQTSVKLLPKSHWGLAEMLLTLQGLASDSGMKASRALAKKLLKAQRQACPVLSFLILVNDPVHSTFLSCSFSLSTSPSFSRALASVGCVFPSLPESDETL